LKRRAYIKVMKMLTLKESGMGEQARGSGLGKVLSRIVPFAFGTLPGGSPPRTWRPAYADRGWCIGIFSQDKDSSRQ
jgi:hypothetical protein